MQSTKLPDEFLYLYVKLNDLLQKKTQIQKFSRNNDRKQKFTCSIIRKQYRNKNT